MGFLAGIVARYGLVETGGAWGGAFLSGQRCRLGLHYMPELYNNTRPVIA